jgi:hypothetical protein
MKMCGRNANQIIKGDGLEGGDSFTCQHAVGRDQQVTVEGSKFVSRHCSIHRSKNSADPTFQSCLLVSKKMLASSST